MPELKHWLRRMPEDIPVGQNRVNITSIMNRRNYIFAFLNLSTPKVKAVDR